MYYYCKRRHMFTFSFCLSSSITKIIWFKSCVVFLKVAISLFLQYLFLTDFADKRSLLLIIYPPQNVYGLTRKMFGLKVKYNIWPNLNCWILQIIIKILRYYFLIFLKSNTLFDFKIKTRNPNWTQNYHRSWFIFRRLKKQHCIMSKHEMIL